MSIIKGGKIEASNIVGKRIVTFSHSRSLDPSEQVEIFSDDRKIKLQQLEFAANSDIVQILIEAKYGDQWGAIGTIRADGSGNSGFTPANIVSQGTGLWKIHSYEDGRYKFSLASELNFPEGFRINVRNSSSATESAQMAVRLYGVAY